MRKDLTPSCHDPNDREVYRKRLPNDLAQIIAALRACGTITAVAVESTFNWYWLVDGLQELWGRVFPSSIFA